MTKKHLANELEKSRKTIQQLISRCDELLTKNNRLTRRCADLARDNAFLNNQMDEAINLIMAKKRAKIGTPAWLKDIMREA